jgi:uncharacterized protein
VLERGANVMKFLLVALVLVIGFFIWRSNRRESVGSKPVPPPQANKPLQDMVACAHCGLHLPRSEAVLGRRALYCSSNHLSLGGDEPA